MLLVFESGMHTALMSRSLCDWEAVRPPLIPSCPIADGLDVADPNDPSSLKTQTVGLLSAVQYLKGKWVLATSSGISTKHKHCKMRLECPRISSRVW